jgi:hypothetical protein
LIEAALQRQREERLIDVETPPIEDVDELGG